MRNNLPCNYFDAFFLKYWMFSLYARVNILRLCAQHEKELPQKRLLCCTWDLSDQWRCYRGGRGGQCPPCCSTIWSTVCLWGWNTCRLCSCHGGRVRLAELSAAPRGCLAARGAQGCGVEGSSTARWLLWVTGVSLWPVTGINKNIVKPLTVHVHRVLPQLKIQQCLVHTRQFLPGDF